MKPTYHDFITKESKKKMVSVGESFQPSIKYTKDDYLTPGKVAKHFGIGIEKARDVMKTLVFKRAAFALNGHKSQIVVRFGKQNGLFLHPMAIEAFKKHLSEQKD
jgi:hypothetical protein